MNDSPSVHPSDGRSSTVQQYLCDAGVYALSRRKRQDLADELQSSGITVEDLDKLRAYVLHSSGDAAVAQRTFVGIVLDPERRSQAIEDIGKRTDVWSQTAPVARYPGESLWKHRDLSEWDERDLSHAIRCYRRDGRSDEEIAEALGITIEEMEELA